MKGKVFIKIGNISVSSAINETIPQALNENHCHDFFEILYVVRGTGKYLVEGVEFAVRPRTLMLFRPFAYHHVSIDDEGGYERLVIHFPKTAVPAQALSMLERISGDEDVCGSYYPPSAIPETLLSVFDRFEVAAALPDEERGAYVKTLIAEIIILLSASKGELMLNTDEELGAKVIRYLNVNIERDINLDRLAKRFFVSKYHLCRAFKKHNGISIHGYLVQKRIIYAKQLIESGETASGAAYKVGFGDYSAFYRAYVKIVGKAPTAE